MFYSKHTEMQDTNGEPYKSAENFFRSGGISNTNVNVRGASEDLKIILQC